MKFKIGLLVTLPLIISLPLAAEENSIFTGESIVIAAQSHHGKGKVTNIDKKGKRVELKHGPIKSIGWMGMQMFFKVDDEEMLEDIKIGDTVDFEFIKTRSGDYVVTDIENDG